MTKETKSKPTIPTGKKPRVTKAALANLQPVKTKEEARVRGRKGGIASGIAKRKAKSFKEMIRQILDDPCPLDPSQTWGEAVSGSMVEKAWRGDVQAFNAVRDTVGEKPVERREISGDQKSPLAFKIERSALVDSFLDSVMEKEGDA